MNAGKRTTAKRPKRPTLFDVAREAGVGTTTVSRVLNGGHYVEASTMARIRAVMERIGYQPNHAARALKGERTHSIGVIVPTLLDPFFARLASVVQEIARRKQYVVIVLASQDDAQQELIELEQFQSFRVDGLLVVPPRQQSRKLMAALADLDRPTVALDRRLTGPFSSVTSDNFEAAREGVTHLIEHGRREILCFGGDPELLTIQDRIRGYEEAVRSAGLRATVMTGSKPEPMAERLQEHFAAAKRRPDAVFALHGDASVAAYEALIDSRYRLGTDVALLGFDDFPLAATLRPPVSVIRQATDEIAQAATQILFDAIASGTRTPRQVTIATELVRRASCGCGMERGKKAR